MLDIRSVYHEKDREPADFPLFSQVWEVLLMAPSSKHADEEELISLAWDAFDYLQADGEWFTASETGSTVMALQDGNLQVKETDDRDFRFEQVYPINTSGIPAE